MIFDWKKQGISDFQACLWYVNLSVFIQNLRHILQSSSAISIVYNYIHAVENLDYKFLLICIDC